MNSPLTDVEYAAALADLAEYERRIAESDRLAQRDSLRVAETLDRLYRDQRWVEERNAQRTATAKTPRGGRPVDPTSRSQFSTWVRDRYNRVAPSRVYQLLDGWKIRTEFLPQVEVTPYQEAQLRPLKSLLSMANGQGARIPEVWEIACKLAAEQLRDQPTSEDVKQAIAEWRRLHIPPAQAKRERAEDRGWVLERQAEAKWLDLARRGTQKQIETFLAAVQRDVDKMRETGARP